MNVEAHDHANQHHQHQASGCQGSDRVVDQADQRTQRADTLQRADQASELLDALTLELLTDAICKQRFESEVQKSSG